MEEMYSTSVCVTDLHIQPKIIANEVFLLKLLDLAGRSNILPDAVIGVK